MNISEFSAGFDILLNSYANSSVFGEQASKSEIALNEHEKSVLLTLAQDIVLKEVFDAQRNPIHKGMDDSTERQVDFSSLITTTVLNEANDQSSVFDDRGIIYVMPLKSIRSGYTFDYTFDYTFQGHEEERTDVLFVLNEKITTLENGIRKTYVVVPINYKEYDRQMSKPYSQPLKRQVWRLFQNNEQGFDIKAELIPRWNIQKESILEYKIRYIRRPYPIILTKLSDDLNIDGYTEPQDCELHPILHPEILRKAVELAIVSHGVIKQDNRQ